MVYKIYLFFLNIQYIPVLDDLCFFFHLRAEKYRKKTIRGKNKFHPTVEIGEDSICTDNISIGEGTYFGSNCQFFAGKVITITIGKYCAIGHNVHVKAKTHDLRKYTPSKQGTNWVVEKNIVIEDHVWIGDNVFIKEGITIGEGSIIGANSVVTKDIEPYTIHAGVPAKKIRNIEKTIIE